MTTDTDLEMRTIAAAEALAAEKDDEALLVMLGKQEKAIAREPSLALQPMLDPDYDSTHMGLVDDLKDLGRRIVARWSRALYELVCGGQGEDADRKKLFEALNVGEAAAIGAVTALLLGMAVPPPVAAAASVVIVRKFLLPAGDEVCDFWGEKLDEA
ncbi:hypothetical protein [Rhodovulum euryhalinum]|uniref:Uncharacterized protein n=1 Tax=Rhodovulum euryhalinum TaxID=35805 RepID=A0A4R2KMX3_9RHOB|nr:hypothetical protein [Rhodovulum euryhalinum]TCO72119.1 hypothetical protein EV655_105227 [Rhodovulum euryhalinum]